MKFVHFHITSKNYTDFFLKWIWMVKLQFYWCWALLHFLPSFLDDILVTSNVLGVPSEFELITFYYTYLVGSQQKCVLRNKTAKANSPTSSAHKHADTCRSAVLWEMKTFPSLQQKETATAAGLGCNCIQSSTDSSNSNNSEKFCVFQTPIW